MPKPTQAQRRVLRAAALRQVQLAVEAIDRWALAEFQSPHPSDSRCSNSLCIVARAGRAALEEKG